MKDMRAVRANEKIKRASTLVGNGGLTLMGAGLARLFLAATDLAAAIWILLGISLTFVAVQMNDLLDSEDEI